MTTRQDLDTALQLIKELKATLPCIGMGISESFGTSIHLRAEDFTALGLTFQELPHDDTYVRHEARVGDVIVFSLVNKQAGPVNLARPSATAELPGCEPAAPARHQINRRRK